MQFIDKDLLSRTRDHLTRLIQLILYRRGVTNDEYVHAHTEHWRRYNSGKDASMAAGNRTHLRKILTHPGANVTWKMFNHALLVFRFDIVRISVTIRDQRTGELTTYHSDDPCDDPNPR